MSEYDLTRAENDYLDRLSNWDGDDDEQNDDGDWQYDCWRDSKLSDGEDD